MPPNGIMSKTLSETIKNLSDYQPSNQINIGIHLHLSLSLSLSLCIYIYIYMLSLSWPAKSMNFLDYPLLCVPISHCFYSGLCTKMKGNTTFSGRIILKTGKNLTKEFHVANPQVSSGVIYYFTWGFEKWNSVMSFILLLVYIYIYIYMEVI